MIKILHSADWHLDTPFVGRTAEETAQLRAALLGIPGKLALLCRAQQCDLVLLSGDLFDGAYTRESFRVMADALEEMAVPVFIAPGNHDFCAPASPYEAEVWPENVHIFTQAAIESVALSALDCRIYGAGYHAMDCPGLLDGFHAQGDETYHIAVLHGDPTQKNSPYCPITDSQIRKSGLDYLALGHIHKGDSFRAGGTLCAWPGCVMGRGFDETGEKGALIVTVDQEAKATFVPLDTPRFYDLTVSAGFDPIASVAAVLPGGKSDDFFRLTLTGECSGVDIPALSREFSRFPHLELRDRTVPETDIWGNAGDDTLEGLYFQLLKQQLELMDPQTVTAAARISRQILDGQEVALP